MVSYHHKGQSTVEYLLLVTAAIAVVVVFLLSNNSVFQHRLANTLDISSNSMENAAMRLMP